MKNYLFLGHSHIETLRKAYSNIEGDSPVEVHFINLREERFLLPAPLKNAGNRVTAASWVTGIDQAAVTEAIRAIAPDVTLLCVNGNQHNIFGLFQSAEMTGRQKIQQLEEQVQTMLTDWLTFLVPLLPGQVRLLPSPPPTDSAERIQQFLLNLKQNKVSQGHRIETAEFRLRLWKKQDELVRKVGRAFALSVIELPNSIFSDRGFLVDECWDKDPTHGNAEYGRRIFREVFTLFPATAPPPLPAVAPTPIGQAARSTNPYSTLNDHSFWKESVSNKPCAEVDPVTSPPFRIGPEDKVATAGSCFAQHISSRLKLNGFNFFVTERPATETVAGEQRGIYDFSARYGNIYTSRQLLQLFDRAFGFFSPIEPVWKRSDGAFCDPFRPRIKPEGFSSEAAVLDDTRTHLAAVKRMFTELDILVFTLGLTEVWLSRLDGAAYPLAPGVAAGEFDPDKHEFLNLSVADVTADLRTFLKKLQLVNPRARVILTVSPVPLVATALDRHVLPATTYSKAVLRVAAEEIAASHGNVYYFPSFEIITGPHAGGHYFGADRRSVTEQGVDHVMRIFMSRLTEQPAGAKQMQDPGAKPAVDAVLARMEAIVEAACDEELLAKP